ncbi:MAG: hypothetical protein ACHP8B_10905 [Terriglobales bacterium]
MSIDNIPAALREPALWLQYYPSPGKPGKKPRKHPEVKYATADDRAANLRSLDYLIKERKLRPGGGYQRWCDPAEGLTYIDLDHARNAETGAVEERAQAIIDALDTYTEVSASGTGFHLVCRARLPGDYKPDGTWVEIWGSGQILNRLMAMTGDTVDCLHTAIDDRQTQAEALFRRTQAGEFGPAVAKSAETALVKLAIPHPVDAEDLPAECLDGWLGEICTERMGAFPRAYAWPALLVTASALVPPGHRCNLFVDLDGPVGSGKSSAFEAAFYLLGLSEPILLNNLKAGSGEGLVQRVGDVGGAARLLYPDELSHLLQKSAIERSSLPQILTSAFYGDKQETASKRSFLTINARLSLAGGTVSDQFADLFGTATTGGLWDRFIYGRCPTGFDYLWRDIREQGPPALVPPMDEDEPPSAVPIAIDRSVWETRDEWVKKCGINKRVAEICIRAAMVCASLNHNRQPGGSLKGGELGPAFALAKYQMKVRQILQPNPGENPDARAAFAIRNWLGHNMADGEWVAQRTVYQGVHAARMGPGVFDRAVKNMVFCEELERIEGRPVRIRMRSGAIDSAPDGTTSAVNAVPEVVPPRAHNREGQPNLACV